MLPGLELNLVGVVLDPHWIAFTEDNLAEELLHPVVEHSGGLEHILSNQFMQSCVHVCPNEFFHRDPVTLPRFDLMDEHQLSIHQLALVVDGVASVHQDCGKVGNPPHVTTTEGEEHVEGTKVVQLGQQLILYGLPVGWCVFDVLQRPISIIKLVGDTVTRLHLLASLSNQGDIAPDSLLLQVGHNSILVGGRPGKPHLLVEKSLDEVALLSQSDWSVGMVFPTAAIRVVKVGKGFSVPVFITNHAYGCLTLAWCHRDLREVVNQTG